MAPSDRTRDSAHKLKHRRFHLNINENVFRLFWDFVCLGFWGVLWLFFFCCEGDSPGTGCQGRLWGLYHWR